MSDIRIVETDYQVPPVNGDVLLYTASGDVWVPRSLSSAGIAPSGAKYIVQEAHSGLSAEQSLGALTTGILKNTVAGAVGTLSIDALITAIAALGQGIVVITGASSAAVRSISVPAGMSITNADGVAGNPTIALADDLAALEALASTGILVRTGSNTYSLRTITGTANEIGVTNGNGVSGNPTLALANATTDFSSSATLGASAGTYSATTIEQWRYRRIGDLVYCFVRFNGTNSVVAGYLTTTLPFAARTAAEQRIQVPIFHSGATNQAGYILIPSGSSTAQIYRHDNSNWPASAGNYMLGNFCYLAAP